MQPIEKNTKQTYMQQLYETLLQVEENIINRDADAVTSCLLQIDEFYEKIMAISNVSKTIFSEEEHQQMQTLKQSIIEQNETNMNLLQQDKQQHKEMLQQMKKKVQASQVYNNMRKQYY